MSTSLFYREQAARETRAAGASMLENVRDRCERASAAWTALAERVERADGARAQAVADKLLGSLSENPDRGFVSTQYPIAQQR